MDFQKIVDGIGAMACIVSVDTNEEGGNVIFRIVAGNESYIASIEHPAEQMHLADKKFVPNTNYLEYIPRDANFEQFCYKAAVEGKCLHAYAHPDRFDFWFNMTFLPIVGGDEHLHYCTYIMEVNPVADTSQMVDISKELAQTVLEICIKLRGAKDFRASMHDVICDIRDLCGARRCCIILTDPVERSCDVLCEAQEEGCTLTPIAQVIGPHFYDLVETWEETIGGTSGLVVSNEKDMGFIKERNPKWFESLSNAGVNSLILYPIKAKDELLGYIWATNFKEEKSLDIKETLELTTYILESEIANYQLLERLQVLSNKDMLTGVQNRNRMNHYVDELALGKAERGNPVGVLFADLNDLKSVNDIEGHGAGDDLLRAAAASLKEVFSEELIFRAGGDEFTVIQPSITPEELEELVEKTREASSRKARVSFAIGSEWVSDAKDVRTALRIADERMYEDKKKYYEQHPEKRRTLGLEYDS